MRESRTLAAFPKSYGPDSAAFVKFIIHNNYYIVKTSKGSKGILKKYSHNVLDPPL
jgi:hypothetical protein